MKLRSNLWFRIAKCVGTGLAATAVTWIACAQGVSTTTVQGTVYLANGKPGSGSLQLSWPAFTTADNRAVAAGRTTAAVGLDGNVSVSLAPNLGSTPAGLYYTAVFHLSDGTTSTEYWVVPPADQVSIAQVRAQVMPAAQAVQAVSKAYVDQAIQSVSQGSLTSTGGALTGPLYLNGDPTLPLQAADKRYVDAAFAKAVPLTGATMTGPLTLENRTDTEIDYILKPGLAASQKGAFVYEDWNGTSQWSMAKDAGNNWALNSSPSGLNSLKAYQSSNGGDTLVNAASPSGVVRVNYESGSGSAFNIYGGGSNQLYASFSGASAIQFPGLAPTSGTNCLQIDATGSMSKTGAPCSTASGTVSNGNAGQIAYYTGAGTSLGGMSAVPITAGGTGASTAAGAVMALSAASLVTSMAQSFAGPLNAPSVNSSVNSQINVMAPPYNAKGDGVTDDATAINAACTAAKAYNPPAQVYFPKVSTFYLASTLTSCTGVSLKGQPGVGQATGGGGVIIQGKPGQDIIHGGDPNSTTGTVNGTWDISDIQFRVDDSVDASASFPHRWPGRWVDDGAMTSGSAVATSNKILFTCSDIGQPIRVKGAGASGGDLITTIASMPSCSQGTSPTATLAAAAATTVSNALIYVSVDNIPVTQNIGNCVFGYDNYDGNQSHWRTSWIGNIYSTIHNVTLTSTSGQNQNNSCGMFFQGAWAPYGTRFEHFNIIRLQYGVLQTDPDTAPSMGNSGNDYQTWDHMLIQATYPWISYNGSDGVIREWQLASIYGPVLSAVSTQWQWGVFNWDIQAPEFEINSGGISWILKGGQHHLHNVGLSVGTAYFDTVGTVCSPCSAAGNIVINGAGNRIDLTGTVDAYNTGGGKSITDHGSNNVVTGDVLSIPVQGRQPTRNTALNITRSLGLVGARTSDFLVAGAGTTPYYNQQDLLFFPVDYGFNGSPFAISTDSNSFSGQYIAITSSMATSMFATFNALGAGTIVGKNVPAAKVAVYDTAKCPSATSYNFKIIANSSVVSQATFACSTTYATHSLSADLSAYAGQNINLGWDVTGEVDDSWSAIRPVNTDTINDALRSPLFAGRLNLATGSQLLLPCSGGLQWNGGGAPPVSCNSFDANSPSGESMQLSTSTWSRINGFNSTSWTIGNQTRAVPQTWYITGYSASAWSMTITMLCGGTNLGTVNIPWTTSYATYPLTFDFSGCAGSSVVGINFDGAGHPATFISSIALPLAFGNQLPAPTAAGQIPVSVSAAGGYVYKAAVLSYSATSASLGGSALTAGQCTAAVTSVAAGVASGMAVAATPNTYPGDGFWWEGYVSSAGNVTVKVCAAVAGTPAASTYAIRVLP